MWPSGALQVPGERGRDELPLHLAVRERLPGLKATVVRAEQRPEIPTKTKIAVGPTYARVGPIGVSMPGSRAARLAMLAYCGAVLRKSTGDNNLSHAPGGPARIVVWGAVRRPAAQPIREGIRRVRPVHAATVVGGPKREGELQLSRSAIALTVSAEPLGILAWPGNWTSASR
ncbi:MULTISPECIES: hypothetical protein [unclassified Streptomyces]|uniref:hypothetical protein n=1 Tax=unclassified Streptomyces TaxID=2593676 RepID=UPI003435D32D